MSKRDLGQLGEKLVVSILRQHGYRILETNYRHKIGEIDIVAKEKDVLCFIEVKTRLSDEFGDGLEAVTIHKQRKLARLAQAYLMQYQLMDHHARFDVISVLGDPDNSPAIEIIKNAFELA
ncbi:MAG TPA: YraN family protein [Candidatus Omnitrophota bacterium]|nr:YraN family protein [Candidatus Omnitrophota bacterium]